MATDHGEVVSMAEASRRAGVSMVTMMDWLRRGLVAEARRAENRWRWEIPASSIPLIQRPRRGRPQRPAEGVPGPEAQVQPAGEEAKSQ